MSAMDLRAVVVRQAPPAVRDAIVRHDSSSEAGDLDNPYVSALAERADGLPLYVVLMMEWLASFRSVAEIKGHIVAALEDPDTSCPVDSTPFTPSWSRAGVLGPSPPSRPSFFVCWARQPSLSTPSRSPLCASGSSSEPPPPKKSVPATSGCAPKCSRSLPRCCALSTTPTAVSAGASSMTASGGISPILRTRPFSAVFASAGQALARLGADPEGSSHEPLRRHLFRHGIAYLRDTHDEAQADALLGDFGYLYRRLGCLGADGIEDLHDDLEHSTDPAIAIWTSFVRACAHFLRREVTGWGPHQSLHQLAYDSAVPAVANAAPEWTKDNHLPTLYQTGGEVISFIG